MGLMAWRIEVFAIPASNPITTPRINSKLPTLILIVRVTSRGKHNIRPHATQTRPRWEPLGIDGRVRARGSVIALKSRPGVAAEAALRLESWHGFDAACRVAEEHTEALLVSDHALKEMGRIIIVKGLTGIKAVVCLGPGEM